MSQESDRPNPVSEEYDVLFDEVGRHQLEPPRQKAVAKIGVKIGWEMTEAIKEFSSSTRTLSRVNLVLTAVIAVATAVYAWVAYVNR